MQMRFLRNLFVAILFLVLTVSTLVFAVSFSVVSSASASLFMTVVQEAGGTEDLTRKLAEYAAPHFTDDPELQATIIETAQKVVKPEVVRAIVGQALDGVKRVLLSGGTETSATVDLRPLKADVLVEARKVFPEYLDEIERALESVPDKPSVSGLLPFGEPLQGIAGPYRIAANLPLVSAAVALSCVGLMVLILGWRSGGLRLGGSCVLIAGALVLAATFVLSGPLVKNLLEGFPVKLAEGELPIQVNPRALAGAAVDFIIGRARLVSGGCMATGLALALIPRRKEAAPPATPA
jgi:hypothetical protein